MAGRLPFSQLAAVPCGERAYTAIVQNRLWCSRPIKAVARLPRLECRATARLATDRALAARKGATFAWRSSIRVEIGVDVGG